MTRLVTFLAIALLGFAVFEVYAIRTELSRRDVNPELLAELKGRLSSLPDTLGDGRFVGRPYEVDRQMIEESGADTYGAIEYFDERKHIYRIYIGGAIAQTENFHAPSYCLPAGGWEMLRHESVELAAPAGSDDESQSVRLLDLQYGNRRMLVYYWFQTGDRVTDHDLKLRWYRFVDTLAQKPLRPTMIVSVYIPYDGELGAAEARAHEFLRTVRPALSRAVDTDDLGINQ